MTRLLAGTPVVKLMEPRKRDGAFSFSTSTNKIYLLQTKNSMAQSWTPHTDFPGDGTFKTITDSQAGGAQRYYRVIER